MLSSNLKWLNPPKITIILVLLSFWVFPTPSTDAVVTADWGDVVDVHYLRYENPSHSGDPAENNTIQYIYLSTGQTVPSEISALYPSANANLFSDFKGGIIGLSENEERVFTATEQGTEYYFRIKLLQIWYDASGGETSPITSTTTTTKSSGGIDTFTILSGGLGIIAVSILVWGYFNQKNRQRALGKDSTSDVRRERSIKQEKTKLKELRELAEFHSSSTDVKETPKSDPKFRRRR